MIKSNLATCLLIGTFFPCFSQSSATTDAWIHTGKISVRFTPTGIHADSSGGFIMHQSNGVSANLLSHLTFWAGGYDPAGNMKISAEMSDTDISDWAPGFRGKPNSNKVWKVTKEQILTHIADFEDNGIIDNPIPDIYAWPGSGNPFSWELNGFETPWNFHHTAEFYDKDDDSIYNPENGDYPICHLIDPSSLIRFPDQFVFSAFHSDTIAHLTHARSTNLDVVMQAATYDCSNHPYLENAVFVGFKMFVSPESELIDSNYFALYADFDIGDPGDDFIGTNISPNKFIYAYNADTTYDAQTGSFPPMINMDLKVGPWDESGNNLLFEHAMPILPNSSTQGMTLPEMRAQFYNYMSGTWKDGSVLICGGNGYANGTEVCKFPFTGNPSQPNAWNERSSGNLPGDRKMVAAFDDFLLLPGSSNQLIVVLTASDKKGPTRQLKELRTLNSLQHYLDLVDWPDNPATEICFPQSSSIAAPNSAVVLSPNPASGYLSLSSLQLPLRSVSIFYSTGLEMTNVHPENNDANHLTFNMEHFPPGVYFVRWEFKNGRQGIEKVVVIH